MLANILIQFLIMKISLAQFDGSFWWMNKELNKFRDEPSPPQFEELNEFDTDESAKIVFRDNDYAFSFSDLVIPKPVKGNREEKALEDDDPKLSIQFQDKSVIALPDRVEQDNFIFQDDNNMNGRYVNKTNTEDVLDFKFPDDKEFWNIINGDKINRTVTTTTTERSSTASSVDRIVLIKDKIPVRVHEQNTEAEHICTSMKKIDCTRRGGVVYTKHDRETKRPSFETQSICCILPLPDKTQTSGAHKIHFIDPSKSTNKRIKRSESETAAMKQRKALLLKKYGPKTQVSLNKPVTVKTNHKIVTAEQEDPYWNIKTLNTKSQFSRPYQSTINYDYNFEDYVEDYVVELPKPGLTGLYSDNVSVRPPNWSFVGGRPGSPYGGNLDSEEDGGTSFLYSTIDPRLEDRIGNSKSPIRGRPVKISFSSNENSYNAESQTINYQANPDFHVLQGYKLLNLVRNRSKIHRNEKKTTTTESVYTDDDSKESVLIGSSLESDYGDFDKNQQVYKDCGRVAKESTDYEDDSNGRIVEAEIGSHPWLALVVLTRKRQSILCYATIVTPRAAITAADCVHGKEAPGQITLIAGVWNLGDTAQKGWQKRLATVQIHPQYTPGDLGHNLALLHWKNPLRFNELVQPACLTDPHVGDDCKFFGWGGYDQAIRQHSRWQRATILTPRFCSEKISPAKRADIPSDAFCAEVHSRGTVTGIGGPLMCAVGNRQSVAGVAVWRDNAVVLIPTQEWTVRKIHDLDL